MESKNPKMEWEWYEEMKPPDPYLCTVTVLEPVNGDGALTCSDNELGFSTEVSEKKIDVMGCW
jgi:hypothetical protein